jgi:hypothetical protein
MIRRRYGPGLAQLGLFTASGSVETPLLCQSTFLLWKFLPMAPLHASENDRKNPSPTQLDLVSDDLPTPKLSSAPNSAP